MPRPKFPWYFYDPSSAAYKAGRRRWERLRPKDEPMTPFTYLIVVVIVLEVLTILAVLGFFRPLG